jgi:hypothetical protein
LGYAQQGKIAKKMQKSSIPVAWWIKNRNKKILFLPGYFFHKTNGTHGALACIPFRHLFQIYVRVYIAQVSILVFLRLLIKVFIFFKLL